MKTLKQYMIMFVEANTLSEVSFYPTSGVQTFNGMYVKAKDVSRESMSQSWLLDSTSRIFENGSDVLDSLVVFKFGRDLKDDKDLEPFVLKALQNGIRIQNEDGSYVDYNRFLRSPSGLRAGGAIFCNDNISFRRKLFSLGFDESQIVDVVSKWESKLSLSITSSHPIPVAKPFSIRVVPDVQRKVTVNVKHLKEYEEGKRPENANPCKFKGLDNIVYDVVSDKQSKSGNLDIQYYVETSVQQRTIEAIDGTGIAKAHVFDQIHTVLQMNELERLYCKSAQVRAPYVKGMLHQFDIDLWCDEHGIKTLTDIYGEKFDPRTVDIIIPESMFKGAGLFNNIQEYYDMLNGVVEVDGQTYKIFENNEWFRVANINKKKAPMHELTYQYLQAMIGLNIGDITELAREFVEIVREGVTTNPAVAKKFLGMINDSFDIDDYNKSMVSKAQELLELCPAMFYSSYVQNQLIKCVETSFNSMAQGRVPIYGGYHFITGDITLLLLDDSFRVTDGKGRVSNRVLEENEQVGLLAKGHSYLAGETGDFMCYRSPLIHPSEVAKLTFAINEEYNKWFGHLTGIIVMNSYEPIALSMGGADYDGDKIYKTNHPILLKAHRPLNYVIISPLENLKADKENVTAEAIYKMDERTMSNFTGIFTDMGTYYINELYHNMYHFNQAINAIEHGCDINTLWDIKCKFFPTSQKLNPQAPNFAEQLHWSLKQRLNSIVSELDYKLTIIRIAQAGEIDFPKHGTRFELPMNVETQNNCLWLKPGKAEEEKDKADNKKKIKRLDTPMQFIFDTVQSEWSKIVKQVKNQSATISTEQYLMGRNVDDGEFIRILPMVTQLGNDYNNEISLVREEVKNADDDTKNERFKTLYNKYIELADNITADRKALAKACVYYTYNFKSQNASQSFPFVVAYDGLLLNLADYDNTSTRIIPAEGLDKYKRQFAGVVKVLQDGNVGVYSTGMETINVELPVELPVGEYNIICVKGRHYVEVKYVMSKEEKSALIKHYYENRASQDTNKKKDPSVHSYKAVRDVDYTFVISGLKFNDLNALKAKDLIDNNNGRINFDYTEVKGTKQIGAFVGEQLLGLVARIDTLKVKGNELIDLSDFVGKAIDVTYASDELLNKDKTPSSRIKITCKVASNVHFSQKLDRVHASCDLTKWYWNVQWKQFREYGFEFLGVDVDTDKKINVGDVVANVRFSCQGLPYVVKVVRDGKLGLNVNSVIDVTNNTVNNTNPFDMEQTATILRAGSYFYAKAKLEKDLALQSSMQECMIEAIDNNIVPVLK